MNIVKWHQALEPDVSKLAHTEELLTLSCVIEIGPMAGMRQNLVIPRSLLDNLILHFKSLTELRTRHIATMLKVDLRSKLESVREIPTDMVHDIAVLFACFIVYKGFRTIQGSGIKSIAVLIQSDSSLLTWRQRGMLDPDLVSSLKLPKREMVQKSGDSKELFDDKVDNQ